MTTEKYIRLAFMSSDLKPPSVLWMRRMLNGLADSVSLVVMEHEQEGQVRERFPTVALLKRPPFRWRIAHRLGMNAKHYRKSLDRKLLRHLHQQHIEAVLVNYADIAVRFSRVWRDVRIPVFVFCHGYDVTWDMRSHSGRAARSDNPDYSTHIAGLPSNVRFISNSEETRGRLTRIGVSTDRIVVNYIGVPVPSSPPMREAATCLTILYLGRLIDCKGPDRVIEAFVEARSRGLQARLIIAGDGPLREKCESIRDRSAFHDSIVFRGAVDEAEGARLLREADIFTAHHCKGPVSNQIEAFGVSIVEAMAAALPVVVGRSGGVPEIVRSGVDGFMVEPGDVQSHAEALLVLGASEETRREMGINGWRRAGECFSEESQISNLRHILSSAALA